MVQQLSVETEPQLSQTGTHITQNCGSGIEAAMSKHKIEHHGGGGWGFGTWFLIFVVIVLVLYLSKSTFNKYYRKMDTKDSFKFWTKLWWGIHKVD